MNINLDVFLTSFFIIALISGAMWQIFVAGRRSQAVVADDLLSEQGGESAEQLSAAGEQFNFSGEAGALGLFKPAEYRKFSRAVNLYPWIGVAAGICSRFILFPLSSPSSTIVALAVFGGAGGYLFGQSVKRAQGKSWARRCEFCLPLTMERLVMAVQAGLDLIAALNVILEDERKTPTKDPVLELLSIVLKLTESGLPFEQALKEVGSRVQLTAIRHAFTHLAIAHKEGGELVMPLKELSDATQSYYQETVEEEIARLPVQATLPLLCTFAGLIICFITSPLIQVISMTSGVAGGLK